MALKRDGGGGQRGAAVVITALCLVLGSSAAWADAPGGQNVVQNNAAPAATLQVTGTDTRFSISATHADVQETLKLVFDQAGRQFTLDNSVTGQVSLRLTDQPLNVILDAICRQSFLRYRRNAVTGVTLFERDDEAVRAAFSRLRSLDASLRDQLRLLGISLPSETALGVAPQGYRGALINPGDALNQNGGFGLQNQAEGALRQFARPKEQETPALPSGAGGRVNNQSLVTPASPSGPVVAQSGKADSAAASDIDKANEMQLFLQTNNLVGFHIPADKPEPVYSVLQNLAQQANVTMLIDPNVPSGSKFTLRGSLSPRPLPEALNILAPYARLEWRWVGSTIFVQTAPDFQIFYGDEKEPRARYAPQQNQRRTDAPAATKKAEAKDTPKTKP